MTKSDIISVASKTGITKAKATEVVNAIFTAMRNDIANGNTVSIIDFGNFSVVEKGERTARNPQTGETIKVAAHKTVKFKASTVLKNAVNK